MLVLGPLGPLAGLTDGDARATLVSTRGGEEVDCGTTRVGLW